MSTNKPLPSLDDLLTGMGVAGGRVCEIDASEAGAGNMSVLIGWEVDPRRIFPVQQRIDLPLPVPSLAGHTLLVTGSGRRLRQIRTDPLANVGAVRVHDDGRAATLHTAPHRLFDKLTSEFNSHLAVHHDQVSRQDLRFQAIVHAQPPHLTYLSHIPAYRNTDALNQRILRWEPETIINLPRGVGVLDFMVPGSPELMAANVDGLRTFDVVLWSKHGVMARSDHSITRAVDLIEYAETAARYEYMNLIAGSPAEGLTSDEVKQVAVRFGITSPWIE